MLSVLRRVVAVFALAGSAIALGTGVLVVTSVTLRALITRPIPGDVELTQFGVALAISLALPWCQLHGSNIIVDFFTQKLRARVNRLLDGIGCLLIAIMCALLAWRTGVGAVSVREAHEASMILDLPMWWVYASLAPGLALTAVVALVQAAMYLRGDDLAGLTGKAA
jgi:TRAP-type C4-dicarboxylate transport system permease small subunit